MRDNPAALPAFDLSLGRPDLLGADWDGEGTNFAIFSDHATAVELCLFDASGRAETARLELPQMEGGIWHGYLPGIGPGQAYGYRVHGPHDPEAGHRFNPAKLLLDPYAREMRGYLQWDDALFGYPVGGDDREIDTRDSAPFMPKAVVADPDFDWDADRALWTRWQDTVIYEAHVKGLTMRHRLVPEEIRGTFAALGSPPVIEHLQKLGVTAIELLPVQAMVQDRHLVEKGLSNYWGYNTLAFFAPNRSYLAGESVREVKDAVRRLHSAGIEVILDVVYNHTAEGSELGPTLSFRGIDNASYYLLAEDRRHCFDTTGCGNTLNVAHPMVLRMVMDSLRYWVQVMHVDGFRFDLASTLGREPQGFEREGAFFAAIRQDPVLSRVKLIAEPWDIGAGGYQVGGFPWPFREWNDKFRDDTRGFWRRDGGQIGRISQRLLGSPVQFDHSRRPATSSVNFIAAHDGFTLWDTVSYCEKHNEANGEENRDGHDHNISDNLGHEGPCDDPGIAEARKRRATAMLSTLMLSQGVPMILGGDELGNSQGGNNNVYAQDNETGWIDWEAARPDLTEAVATLTRLRRERIGLLAPQFFARGAAAPATEEERPLVRWLHPEGRAMGQGDWQDPQARCLGLELRHASEPARMLLILNAGDDARFVLPAGRWRLEWDSSGTLETGPVAQEAIELPWQSVLVLDQDVAPS
ncbi:glycogen debranching protein GlgX [Mangrovicoccus algicola]|uniref:Glycogen debranching protein GlgX n=1 Tax=Mangrovicoccus algicola TaxID=2771008 RepID=A0A8J6YVG8_9RHOB|nr:glycogen debranching protein GlgX [Mangrovicoccus algicola]MBE3636818.1 glycogen debranching protein GlgX [Mangrovicoccus algicola]